MHGCAKASQISISNQLIECQAAERKANTGKAEREKVSKELHLGNFRISNKGTLAMKWSKFKMMHKAKGGAKT